MFFLSENQLIAILVDLFMAGGEPTRHIIGLFLIIFFLNMFHDELYLLY